MIRIAKIGGGLVLLILGVAMLALPGPGWAAIFAALAILATEFDWARRLLERLKAAVATGSRAISSRARRRSP